MLKVILHYVLVVKLTIFMTSMGVLSFIGGCADPLVRHDTNSGALSGSRTFPLTNEGNQLGGSKIFIECEKGTSVITYTLSEGVGSSNLCILDDNSTANPEDWKSSEQNYCSKKLDKIKAKRKSEGYDCRQRAH